jgi:ribonuclease T
MGKFEIKKRFDGYLPVVIDVETTGVDAQENGLLEVAAVYIDYDSQGRLQPAGETFSRHIVPFEGCRIDEAALKINRIKPEHPFRSMITVSELKAMNDLFDYVSLALKKTGCRRGLLVGHNAHFDLGFIQAAMSRCELTKSPLHAFTVMDTATISGVFFGKTVLAKALRVAGIEFDKNEAHSASYDTLKTAELFCQAVNQLTVPCVDVQVP